MKATETRIEEFLSGNRTQFVIPVYQRNYDWTIPQCKQLLDDILEAGSDKNISAHFIGSIVFIHDDVYSSSRIKELTIIDGQQRITTLSLIYLTIYKLAKQIGKSSLEEEIYETFLINKYAPEERKLKLRPTENNDDAIQFLLRDHDEEEFEGLSRVIDNYNYFKSRIVEENFEVVLKGLSKLMFVEISLDRNKDNPQRIFESLNSTGLELTQADLIRNYILMGLKPVDQKKVYKDYWKIIEKYAKDESSNKSRVSDFIRDYLTVENNKIPNKSKVYMDFKDKYPTTTVADLENILTNIKTLGKHYNKLINPKNETDSEIRKQLEYINRLEINVAYPFLLKVYDDYDKGVIDKSTFVEILEFVQTYTWRRFIVGLPTNALNKIFMNLYDKVDPEEYLLSIQKSLLQRSGVQRFPRNKEVIDSLKVKDVYNINSKNRTYLLERLENYNNREPVKIEGNSDITIEHIFPQNPEAKWKIEMSSDDYNEMKNTYINTISNLTLTGYNSKLSNKYFTEKRDLKDFGFRYSRLWLNKYIGKLEKWDPSEIEKRFELISEQFLKIWTMPEIDLEEATFGEEVNIFEAEEPTGKKLEYAIFFDEKLHVNQVSKLYKEVIRQLFELEPQKFFTTDLAEKLTLTKLPTEGSPRTPMAINETYYIESNLDNKGKFDRIKLVLESFDIEDELLIKYQED